MYHVTKNDALFLKRDFFLQEHLNALADSFSGNYWWKDVHGVYHAFNDRLAEVLGFKSSDDVIGKTDYELPWKDSADKLIEHDNLVIVSKTFLIRIENIMDTRGEEHMFQVTKLPLLDDSGKVIGTVGTSVMIYDSCRWLRLFME